MICNNKVNKLAPQVRRRDHHQLSKSALVLTIAESTTTSSSSRPVSSLFSIQRGVRCLIAVQLSLHSADSTLTSQKHLLLWGGLLAPAVSRWPTIVWVCAKVLLHRSSSTSGAFCTPVVPHWKSAASSLRHYLCDLRYCLPIALLISRVTGSPQRDDYDSPTMNPHYDNRTPSPGRLLHYQGGDAPYRPQPPPLQMPMMSSDRLAVQPTVCTN